MIPHFYCIFWVLGVSAFSKIKWKQISQASIPQKRKVVAGREGRDIWWAECLTLTIVGPSSNIEKSDFCFSQILFLFETW